jgi:hypothetical protein
VNKGEIMKGIIMAILTILFITILASANPSQAIIIYADEVTAKK